MLLDFDLDRFIADKVTRRPRSLLADDLAAHDAALRAALENSRVLVIGGAGSIGSHYIKALLRYPVAKLCVVDHDENGLTELVRDLRSGAVANVPADFTTYPVNFASPVFDKIFRQLGPFDVVANFAAHKHVRSEKDIFSIEAMFENNLFKARHLLELLLQQPPRHFFCVSTDKAANPVNIMGASKKLMEELILSYADRLPVTTARFANVAFSNGSLPHGFLVRLAKRQPWSCPRAIRRFFVSPIEAGELCLLASIIGESGDIIYPILDEARDMITFEQIARDLLQTLGLEPDLCQTEAEARQRMTASGQECALAPDCPTMRWPLYLFDSATSGEKPYEEFFTASERRITGRFANLGIVKGSTRRSRAEFDTIFAQLKECFSRPAATKADVVRILCDLLPHFDHIETGKGLDQKM